MTGRVGCVACTSLYDVIERSDHAVDTRFVRQELHESPVDPGDDDRIAERVQRAIDDLEGSGRSPIAICYSTAGNGLADIRSASTPLRIWTVEDCTSALLAGETKADSRLKEPHTYYLTRGAIDRGLDPLKLYLGQTGDDGQLIESIRSAAARHPDMVVDWFEGERYRGLSESGSKSESEVRLRVFAELLGYYRRVVLLDTGTLHPYHHEYADRFGSFLEDVHRSVGRPTTVSVTHTDASDVLVRSMLRETTAGAESPHPCMAMAPPGEPVAAALDGHR